MGQDQQNKIQLQAVAILNGANRATQAACHHTCTVKHSINSLSHWCTRVRRATR